MKVECSREDLSLALARVKALIGGATTLPILSCVLLKAEGDRLSLTGSNLDHALTLILPCSVLKPGTIAVSAARLAAAVSRMGEEATVTAEHQGKSLVCSSGDLKLTLFALDGTEFPAMPSVSDEGELVVLASGVLGQAIPKVLPFVGDDPGRYVLCGVYFHAENGASAPRWHRRPPPNHGRARGRRITQRHCAHRGCKATARARHRRRSSSAAERYAIRCTRQQLASSRQTDRW